MTNKNFFNLSFTFKMSKTRGSTAYNSLAYNVSWNQIYVEYWKFNNIRIELFILADNLVILFSMLKPDIQPDLQEKGSINLFDIRGPKAN